MTRDYATLIPSDARNNHQEGKINDEPTRSSCVKAVSVISTGTVQIRPEHPYGTRPIALLAVPKVKAAVARNLAKLKQVLEADGPA